MNKVSDITLHHDSFISLHVQLHNQLRQLILSGRWPAGSRIPSESQLTSHLNISRSTVRLALQQAELESLIERHPGKGTFVANHRTHERHNRLIAYMTCGFDSETHTLMLNGADDEVKAYGYRIIFRNVQNRDEEIEVLKRLKADGVAGVLLWPTANGSASWQQNQVNYQQVNLPVVVMDRQIYGVECDCVTSDNYGGARALMQHLVELGHQQIVFLTHHETELLTVMERYRAYCDVLQEAGLTPAAPWLVGQPGHETGASQILRASVDGKSPVFQQIRDYLLNAQPWPTAIFALNDYLAVLVMRVVKSLGIKIPDDISIVGFDDIDLSVHLDVPLTTVAQDSFAIGKRAARLLIDRLEEYTGPARFETIPTQLRIRSSTSVPIRV
ncbi:MAG: GntR family transcriptional regulator [Chloroflexi bacterium]|nr:GntR family transcriptional regulator [Chloroflexota bacterium]